MAPWKLGCFYASDMRVQDRLNAPCEVSWGCEDLGGDSDAVQEDCVPKSSYLTLDIRRRIGLVLTFQRLRPGSTVVASPRAQVNPARNPHRVVFCAWQFLHAAAVRSEEDLQNIQQVFSTAGAFAAIRFLPAYARH